MNVLSEPFERESRASATIRLWSRGAFLLLLGLVLYLTMKPNPAIQEVEWMPRDAARFFDLNDDWKNIVGFGTLAFAAFLGWPQGWGPPVCSYTVRIVGQGIVLCCAVAALELIQLFIPTRFCDLKDMVAGSIGVILAFLLICLLRACLKLRAA